MKTKLTSGAVAETAVRTEANTHQSSGTVSENGQVKPVAFGRWLAVPNDGRDATYHDTKAQAMNALEPLDPAECYHGPRMAVTETPAPADYVAALVADYIAHPNASVKEDAEPTLPGFTLEIKTRHIPARRRKYTAPEEFSFAAFKLSVPQIRETAAPAVSLRTPEDVAAQLGELSTWAQEAFVLFTLDTKNRVIDRHLVTLGTLNASLVHPREVFRRAIVDSAAAVIVAHNHPSGDPAPSAEDISLTRQLVAAGRTVGISVLDHIIIGNPRAGTVAQKISLREAGLVAFE